MTDNYEYLSKEIETNHRDINAMGTKINENNKAISAAKHEMDMKILQSEKRIDIQEQKLFSLVDSLSNMPEMIASIREDIQEIKTENLITINKIETQYGTMATEISHLKAEISSIRIDHRDSENTYKNELKKYKEETDKKIDDLADTIDKIDDKGKFDWIDLVKGKLLPAIFIAGATWFISQFVNGAG